MLFLETSGLLCYLYQEEPQHQEAVRFLGNASRSLTHSYVLAEFVTLAYARRFPRMTALKFMTTLLENPDIETVWIEKSLHREAVELLKARPDKTYFLCDAVSFILMYQRRINEALTIDHHFEQEGFQRLLFPV